eukprot:79707-Pleurochrysis_carterae.AAC.1
MRKSRMPSVIRSGGPSQAVPQDNERRPGSSAATGDAIVVRAPICALYDENDLAPCMESKLRSTFKLPQQDTSKVQMYDESRRSKTLGGISRLNKRPSLAGMSTL